MAGTGKGLWSITPNDNQTADPNVDWQEGQLAPTINNSARSMMAESAKHDLDVKGILATSVVNTGVTTYSVTLNTGVAAFGDLLNFTFIVDTTSQGASLINVTGQGQSALGAKKIVDSSGTDITEGMLVAGARIGLIYNNVDAYVITSGITAPTDLTAYLPLAGGTMSGAIAMGANLLTGVADGVSAQDAVTKTQMETADALKVSKAGDSMTGDLAMGANQVTGVADGTLAQDAVTKSQMETDDALKVSKSGDTMSGALAMGANQITGVADGSSAQDAVTKSQMETADALKLSLTGGTMSGAIAMGANLITGVTNGVSAQDAVTKSQMETADALKLSLSGGTMSGEISMGTSKITGMGDPTLAQDAVTKSYVDTAATTDALQVDGSNAMTATLNAGTNKVSNVVDGTSAQDAATKAQIDLKANLASPTFTGTVTVPTAAVGGAAPNKTQMDAADALNLPLTGGTMSGAIAMGTSKITGVGNGTLAQDVVTKSQMETADALRLALTGGTLSGALAMGANKVTGVTDPTAAQDAATKAYVDATTGGDLQSDGSVAMTAPLEHSNGTALLPSLTFTNDIDSGFYLGSAGVVSASVAGTKMLDLRADYIRPYIPIWMDAGTALLPELSFAVDPDTGLYRSGNNALGITTGGALSASFSTTALTSTVPFLAPNGSAAAPSISLTNDSDTGLYYAGADSLGITAGGTLRATFSSTALTAEVPVLTQYGSAAAPSHSFELDPDTGMYRVVGDSIGFSTNGVNRLTLANTAFHSTVSIYHPDGSAALPSMSFTNDSDTGLSRLAANQLSISTGGTERARVNSSGNVSFANGIVLGDGLNDTAANTLDDYEEGTWTPTLASASGTTTPTYTKQEGSYTKVGNKATLTFDVRWSAVTRGTSTLRIGSTPFVSASVSTGAAGTGNLSEHQSTFTYPSGKTEIVPAMSAGVDYITLLASASATSSVNTAITDVTAGSGYLIGTITHLTA